MQIFLMIIVILIHGPQRVTLFANCIFMTLCICTLYLFMYLHVVFVCSYVVFVHLHVVFVYKIFHPPHHRHPYGTITGPRRPTESDGQ